MKKKPNGEFNIVPHTSTSVEGAVIDFEYYHSENGNHCLLVGVNNRVLIYKIEYAYFDENYTLENSDLLHIITSQIFIYKLKLTGNRLYVADIMKSLTVYNIVEDGEMVEATMECRDPRGSWALDMA